MTRTKVADQRFSLKQWFAGGAQSRGLRKPWLWSTEDAMMHSRAFEQQTIPDFEPLTYLPDGACCSANESNQSPTEENKSNEMLIEAQHQIIEYLIHVNDRTNTTL